MKRLSDLIELKSVLEIDQNNTQEDVKLLFFLEYASDWIAEYLNRPGLFYKTRTEYYNGTNTNSLVLKSRPTYPDNMQVYVQDQGGYYGQGENSFGSNALLTYGSAYVLEIDQEDGTSRCGILRRINDVWPKPWSRGRGMLTPFVTKDTGSIKVVYTGGYTVDGLPSTLRLACNLLVGRMRYMMPVGMELSSESYEDRSISISANEKDYLMGTVKNLLFPYRNWSF